MQRYVPVLSNDPTTYMTLDLHYSSRETESLYINRNRKSSFGLLFFFGSVMYSSILMVYPMAAKESTETRTTMVKARYVKDALKGNSESFLNILSWQAHHTP